MACVEKCFTFQWKLENVSYCLQKMGECIRSPVFVVDSIDETKWYLGIYPRGKEFGNYIAFYLFRDVDRHGCDRVELYYELAFMAEDGSVLISEDKYKFSFPKNHGRGFSKFETLENVFGAKRSTFLPQDTLTARCRIWKVGGDMAENVQCSSCTRIGVEKRSFLWNLKNFSTLESREKYAYEMKSVARDKQLMSINFSFTQGLDSDEIIRFELSLQDHTIKFSSLLLSLVDVSGNRVECNQDEFWFDNHVKYKEFTFFFTKNKLMAMKSYYLPDDSLTLYWEWSFSEGIISEKIEDVQYACTNSDSGFGNAGNMDNKKTLDVPNIWNVDLKSLYDENFLCDFRLKTKTRTFNAHKVILSASSPVFKAMFSSDMKEKESNSVNIEDLSDDTISRMLVYIYTGHIEDLTWETASHLYVAADKYAILSLKNICCSYMKDNLSLSNACEVLLLSDLHADSDLKSAGQNYILQNGKQIINSEEWKGLMQSNSKLATETLCLLFK